MTIATGCFIRKRWWYESPRSCCWNKQTPASGHFRRLINDSQFQAVPLTDDAEAWPGLPGGPSGNATGNPSSAETSENEGEAAHRLGRQGATMADKIARASSTPVKKEESKRKLMTLNGRAKQAGGEAQMEGLNAKAAGDLHHTPFIIRDQNPDWHAKTFISES